jgi:Na+/H+ antiporter NhaD/arsenite permease-like protein
VAGAHTGRGSRCKTQDGEQFGRTGSLLSVTALALALFVAILVISLWRGVNLGITSGAAVLVLAGAASLSSQQVLSAFPADLCVLIVGVSLLFSHAQESGAIDRLIMLSTRLIGSRSYVLPWVGFALGLVLTTVGGFPSAIMALVVPLIARLAIAYRTNYVAVSVATVLGAISGGFSPLSPCGALIRTLTVKAHLHYPPWGLWAVGVTGHAIIAALVVVVYRKDVFVKHSGPLNLDTAAQLDEPTDVTANARYQWACAVSLGVLTASSVLTNVNAGLVAVGLAFVLQLLFRPEEKTILNRVPWSIVVLVTGLLLYLGAAEKAGVFDVLKHALLSLSGPVWGVAALTYFTAILSNVESSTVVIVGVAVPLCISLCSHGAIPLFLGLVAVSLAAATPVMSPVHVGGALVLGNAPENKSGVTKTLLLWALAVSVLVPAAAVTAAAVHRLIS